MRVSTAQVSPAWVNTQGCRWRKIGEIVIISLCVTSVSSTRHTFPKSSLSVGQSNKWRRRDSVKSRSLSSNAPETRKSCFENEYYQVIRCPTVTSALLRFLFSISSALMNGERLPPTATLAIDNVHCFYQLLSQRKSIYLYDAKTFKREVFAFCAPVALGSTDSSCQTCCWPGSEEEKVINVLVTSGWQRLRYSLKTLEGSMWLLERYIVPEFWNAEHFSIL